MAFDLDGRHVFYIIAYAAPKIEALKPVDKRDICN